jgi:hypothetical protein
MIEIPLDERGKPRGQVILDLDQQGNSYQSPITLKMVTSRRQRREDLRVSGCREVDPGEKGSFLTGKCGHDPNNFEF